MTHMIYEADLCPCPGYRWAIWPHHPTIVTLLSKMISPREKSTSSLFAVPCCGAFLLMKIYEKNGQEIIQRDGGTWGETLCNWLPEATLWEKPPRLWGVFLLLPERFSEWTPQSSGQLSNFNREFQEREKAGGKIAKFLETLTYYRKRVVSLLVSGWESPGRRQGQNVLQHVPTVKISIHKWIFLGFFFAEMQRLLNCLYCLESVRKQRPQQAKQLWVYLKGI